MESAKKPIGLIIQHIHQYSISVKLASSMKPPYSRGWMRVLNSLLNHESELLVG